MVEGVAGWAFVLINGSSFRLCAGWRAGPRRRI